MLIEYCFCVFVVWIFSSLKSNNISDLDKVNIIKSLSIFVILGDCVLNIVIYNVLWFNLFMFIHLIFGVSCFYNWHTFNLHCIRSKGPYSIYNRNYVTSCTPLKNRDWILRAHFKLLFGKTIVFRRLLNEIDAFKKTYLRNVNLKTKRVMVQC